MYGIVFLLHVLAATVWTGGHIVLSFVILPRALDQSSAKVLLDFESVFEKIGMPALIIQILSGLWLAHHMLPDLSQWLNLANPLSHPILLKLSLLLLTIGFAINARFRVIPHLNDSNLRLMAWHILPVTLFSILFVVAGVSFRTGWLY